MKNSIVTKTGDSGQTFLLAGVRIAKNNIRVKTYGESDELNSLLGVAQSSVKQKDILKILEQLQSQIFELSAILATPSSSIKPEDETKHTNLVTNYITFLEQNIDQLEPQLPELKNFILPGGNQGSAFLHLARTVCRRVERTIIDLREVEQVNPKLIIYFNRLSDLLFILARYENFKSNVKENIWISQQSKQE